MTLKCWDQNDDENESSGHPVSEGINTLDFGPALYIIRRDEKCTMS